MKYNNFPIPNQRSSDTLLLPYISDESCSAGPWCRLIACVPGPSWTFALERSYASPSCPPSLPRCKPSCLLPEWRNSSCQVGSGKAIQVPNFLQTPTPLSLTPCLSSKGFLTPHLQTLSWEELCARLHFSLQREESVFHSLCLRGPFPSPYSESFMSMWIVHTSLC